MWVSLIPFGAGAWVPIVAGLRAGERRWTAFGVVATILAFGGFVLVGVSDETSALSDVGLAATLLGWVGAAACALAIRDPYRLRVAARRSTAVADVAWSVREQERAAALALAAADPEAAVARGIGRPDVPGARHGHVVDLNHAPPAVLATLPGLTPEVVQRLVAAREGIGAFSSVDDAAFLLDLPPAAVAQLRRVAVALPH